MQVLVLGAYGLIGGAIVDALLREGHAVCGLGRSVEAARQRWPGVTWIARDLRDLQNPTEWHGLLHGMDAVVNAAGVLQDGAGDNVAAVQSGAMRALIACASERAKDGPKQRPRIMVQISAVGAEPAAATTFMATKADADAALAASGLDWIILRPGLVIAPTAYGATALLRALAAFPVILPVAAATAQIQTIAVGDVAGATLRAIAGDLPFRRSFDLVEDFPHSLAEVLARFRAQLGLKPATVLPVPMACARLAFRAGDLLGWLGWRTPVRSTALRQLVASITGDPEPWRAATGHGIAPLDETLKRLPRSVQDLWFARLWLLKPLIIATLAMFWVLTGLIALRDISAAASILTIRGMPAGWANILVILGAKLDIILGLGVLIRRYMPLACTGMIALSAAYLLAGSILAADLWFDPLGPFIKVLPGIVLALVALAVARER